MHCVLGTLIARGQSENRGDETNSPWRKGTPSYFSGDRKGKLSWSVWGGKIAEIHFSRGGGAAAGGRLRQYKEKVGKKVYFPEKRKEKN